jgi:hypothetical protein
MDKVVKFAVREKEDGKARVVLNFNTDTGRAFYVRFYVDELEQDFVEVFNALSSRDITLKVTHKNGTYCVTDKGRMSAEHSFAAWDILMHKCWSLSNEVRKDNETGEKFYPIRLSDQFIEPCARKLA